MSKAFETHLLVQGTDGKPELVHAEVNLHPGRSLSVDREETILLAGGFASIAPETEFLLSPTFQLNADLSSFSSEQLTAIALAEVEREQRKMYRGYAVDADTRLCVVSSSVESLDGFVETYGGVLMIEPLLVKGSDENYPTVTEMSVERGGNSGVSVEYGVRSPIDTSLCTYCGNCGASCPENCISPTLYFDFSACTFCKKCEEVCPVDAIQIYGLEYKTLVVPALLLLDGCQVEGTAECSAVYTEETFSEYLKSLYSYQVDEIVSVDQSLCHYNDHLSKGCTLCYEACQHNAITLAGGVHIDPLSCEECGDCVAVCPTGALQYERLTDISFRKYLAALPLSDASTVVLASTEEFHAFWWHNQGNTYENTLFLTCERPEFFSLANLLYLYSQGGRRIVVARDEDHAGRVVERNLKLANTIVTALYDCAPPIILVDTLDDADLGASVSPIASQSVLEGKDWSNRREMQSDVLAHLVAESNKTPGFKGNQQTSFATITCDIDRCTQCMSCINVCKIQAMTADETEMIISHQSALCVACGLCVSVCPENALKMSRNWQFTDTFFQKEVMAAGEAMACPRCGKIFGTKKSYERVMSILASKESVDTTHFQYCDDCRVIRLFEEHK